MGGVNQTLGSWVVRNFPPPPSLLSSWMNVYYIFKHKKLCDKEIGLCLLQINGGSRGWKSIGSDVRRGGASKHW